MPTQPSTSRAAYLSQTLADPALVGFRAQEVADMVATLSDLSHTVQELSGLVGEAEMHAAKLAQRLTQGSARRSAAAKALDDQAAAQELGSARAQVRRLREALHDAQKAMDDVGAGQGHSSEIAALRMQCQQDDMRARLAEADMAALAEQAETRDLEVGQGRRRQEQRQRGGVQVQTAGSHLTVPEHGGKGASQSVPPAALMEEMTDIAQRAGAYVRRESNQGGLTAHPGETSSAGSSQKADIQARFAKVLTRPEMPRFQDPSDMVQWVIRQAHTDGAQDIQGYAHKLHFSTQLKDAIREELSRARKFRSDHGATLKNGAMDAPFDRMNLSRDPAIGDDGVPRVRPVQPAGEITQVEEMDAHIADLQNMLASTGEDMQISQLELQNMTQRQQQVMNVLSNLSKTLHETSMAIIRKIGN